jgi:LacI family transcriptional regulator
MNDKIRIKDIAERAGVSVGTVDRVLHNRPNVSPKAREKVEAALKEVDYHPNMYASALAYNKSYIFYIVMPRHEQEAYWEEIEQGAHKAMEARRDFHINVRILHYQRFSVESFNEQCDECLSNNPDGVVIVPSALEETRNFTDNFTN